MSQTDAVHTFQRTGISGTDLEQNDEPTVDTTEVLSLLSDEYARELIDILLEEPLSARELSDRLDMSRPTVYRRLNRLESAGVIEGSMVVDPEGHHRNRFSVVVDHLQLQFESDGIRLEASG